MLEKDFTDYLLFFGGILINFLLLILFFFGVSLGLGCSIRWILVIVSGTILSYLMTREWQRTFIIDKIKKESEPEENFRKCHKVIKTYWHEILDNIFEEYYLKAR